MNTLVFEELCLEIPDFKFNWDPTCVDSETSGVDSHYNFFVI